MTKILKSLAAISLFLFLAACQNGSNGTSGGGNGGSNGPTPPGINSPGPSTAGQLDLSFNGVGYKTVSGETVPASARLKTALSTPITGYAQGFATAIDSQGRIVIVGVGYDQSNYANAVVWRFMPDGSFDTSFATQGVFWITHTASALGTGDSAVAIVVDANDSIYFGGSSDYSTDGVFGSPVQAIWKVTASGVLDTTFNATGHWTDPGHSFSYVQGLTLDASGRLLATGLYLPNPTGVYPPDLSGPVYAMVERFTTAGVPDTTFGTNGTWSISGTAVGGAGNATSGMGDSAFSLVPDGSGNLYVSGGSITSTTTSVAVVWKVLPDGQGLDTTFGTSGFWVDSPIAQRVGFAFASHLQGDGTMFLAGGSFDVTQLNEAADARLWKLTSNGTVDPTFNSGNTIVMQGVAGGTGNLAGDMLQSVVVDSSSNVMVGGYSRDATGTKRAVVWRFDPITGAPDLLFGGVGHVIPPPPPALISATAPAGVQAIGVYPLNTVVLAGASIDATGQPSTTVWRMLTQ